MSKAQAREKLRIERQKSAWNSIVKSVDGRQVLWDIISFGGLYKEPGEGEQCQRDIGKARVAKYILGMVSDVNEEMLFKMMSENKMRADAESRQIDQETIEETIGQHESQTPTSFADEMI